MLQKQMSVSDKPFYFPDSGFSFECILAKEYQIGLFGLLVIEKLVVLGAMPQIKCNAKNKQKKNKHQLDVKVIELKICSWHVWLTHAHSINFNAWRDTLLPNCQTMCQFTSSHVQSLCCSSRQMLQNGWFNHESENYRLITRHATWLEN